MHDIGQCDAIEIYVCGPLPLPLNPSASRWETGEGERERGQWAHTKTSIGKGCPNHNCLESVCAVENQTNISCPNNKFIQDTSSFPQRWKTFSKQEMSKTRCYWPTYMLWERKVKKQCTKMSVTLLKLSEQITSQVKINISFRPSHKHELSHTHRNSHTHKLTNILTHCERRCPIPKILSHPCYT